MRWTRVVHANKYRREWEKFELEKIYNKTGYTSSCRTPILVRLAGLRCLSGVFFFFFASSTWCRHSMSAKKREGEREIRDLMARDLSEKGCEKREREREGSESADGIGGYKSLAAIIEHSRSCGFDSFQLFYSLFFNFIYIYIYVCVF